jgi:arylsulfatase
MEQAPHNIVVILADQWRWDALSCAGQGSPAATPFIDQLAIAGCRFTNAFSPSPSCIPARACFATGRTPVRTGRLGYVDNQPWPYRHTWMSRLRDHGYETIGVGKTHFIPMRARLGFEELRLYEPRQREPGVVSDYHRWLQGVSGGTVEDVALHGYPNSWVPRPWTHRRDWYCTEWMTREAIEQLERRDPTRPFALYVGYHRPHPPMDPPLDLYERFLTRDDPGPYVGDWCDPPTPLRTAAVHPPNTSLSVDDLRRTRAAYFASIAHVDEQIGSLLWYLYRTGLEESTWIVFTSDHGEFLGDHHRWHKFSLQRSSAGIPLIVRPPQVVLPPGSEARGTTCRTPVDLSDLGTTLCRWGGVDLPDADGIDLTGLALQQVEPERLIHGEHAHRAGNEHALRDARWTYIWDSLIGTERLFDRNADPHELHDLSGSQAAELKRWRGMLAERLEGRLEGFVVDGALRAGATTPRVSDSIRAGRDPIAD